MQKTQYSRFFKIILPDASLACTRGCKTDPCETIDITVRVLGIILPLLSLARLLGLGSFHDGLNRSV